MFIELSAYLQLGALFATYAIIASKSLPASNCHPDTPIRGVLDLTADVKPAQLLNVTNRNTLFACVKECCGVEKCNTYIWKKSEQCFLFNCKLLDDCKIVPHPDTITGFISHNQSPQQQELKQGMKKENLKSAVQKAEREPGVVMKENNGPINSKSLMQDAEARKNEGSSAKLDSQIVKKEERLKEVVKDVHKKEFGSHRKDAKAKNTTLSSVAKSSKKPVVKSEKRKVNHTARPMPVLNMSTAFEKVSHTTTTSLIAALVFGVVFLIAVAVQIGKPWWESLFTNRDGYNRITFLMNGK